MGRILPAPARCLVLALVVSCSGASANTHGALVDEHNRQRAQRGLCALAVDPALCEYAQRHAESMAARGLLVHSSMNNLARDAGSGSVAENVAWGQPSEEEVCRAWMNSPGHRSNILGKNFKRVGFGVKEDAKGRKYWCAVFAA